MKIEKKKIIMKQQKKMKKMKKLKKLKDYINALDYGILSK